MGDLNELLEKMSQKWKMCDSNSLLSLLFNQVGSSSLYLIRLIGSITLLAKI